MNNNFRHAFDPSLAILGLKPHVNQRDIEDSRLLFYQLNQVTHYQDCLPNAYHFICLALQESRTLYSSLNKMLGQNPPALIEARSITPLPNRVSIESNVLDCVNQSSCILLTQPYWLQNVFQTFSSQSNIAMKLMAIYLKLTGHGQNEQNLSEAYRSLLITENIKIPALNSYLFSQQTEILPAVMKLSCIQLALARFPRVLFPELLGFTLAYCQMPTLIEICFPAHQLPKYFFNLRLSRVEKQIPLLLDCIANYLHLFSSQKESLWERLQNGFWLYYGQMYHCRNAYEQLLENTSSTEKVAQLFHQKVAAAIGHHQNIQLQGKSLDLWFSGMPSNSQAFLHALKSSNYIDEEKPENSLLLKLFSFKGPMFGVLNEEELTAIKNWLKDEQVTKLYLYKTVKTTSLVEKNKTKKQVKKLSNRELYYHLVNVDLFPDILPAAKQWVDHLLHACRLFNPLPFKHYDHHLFDGYIDAIYQREIKAYQPLKGKPKITKEAYVWGIEQIAPMILIDGCWLQHSLCIQTIHPEISNILFSIYCDELGNGKIEQSHPVIFQQLLDSLSIKCPPVDSPQFIKHSGFINSAFDLPVYMMGLSQFSIEFLPELLGLNMAIELSGLGKSYMQLVDEWKYWGINPEIASLHISIDNVASGHTFLAKKAIHLYVDNLLRQGADTSMLDQHWRRIYTGYASLQFVGLRFKLGLPIKFLIKEPLTQLIRI